MLVKTFHGRSCTEVFAHVRDSLGADAAILETRRVATGVEVTAAAERPETERTAAAPQTTRGAIPLSAPAGGLDWLAELLATRGFSPFLCERITQAAEANLDENARADRDAVLGYAQTLLALWVQAGPPQRDRRETSVRALIGPSGVGKTSTCAKLAARDVVEGRRVVLASADDRRLGGAEQLEQYARILGVPFQVVRHRRDIDAARRLAGADGVVYLDTPGIPRGDAAALDELRNLLGAVRADEIELLLAADRDAETLADTVQRFRPLGPNAVSATRTDEAVRRGALVTAVARARLPLRVVGNGPDVPYDIEPADSRRLAAWALAAPEERA